MGRIRNFWSRQTQRNQIAAGGAIGTAGFQLLGWLVDKAATLAWQKFLESFVSQERAAKLTAAISGSLSAISDILNDPRVSWALFGGLIVALATLFIPPIVRQFRSILPRYRKSNMNPMAISPVTETSGRDVIPLELRVWGILTDDGIDISPQIVYRNRSPINLKVKPTEAIYILENKEPDGQSSMEFQGDLNKESNSSVSFKPVRVYDIKSQPSGMVAIEFLYGPKDGNLETKLGISYVFKVLSMPKQKGRRELLEFEAVQNFNYENI